MYLVPILVMTVAYAVIMCHFRNYQMPGNMTDNLLAYQYKTKRRVNSKFRVQYMYITMLTTLVIDK